MLIWLNRQEASPAIVKKRKRISRKRKEVEER